MFRFHKCVFDSMSINHEFPIMKLRSPKCATSEATLEITTALLKHAHAILSKMDQCK